MLHTLRLTRAGAALWAFWLALLAAFVALAAAAHNAHPAPLDERATVWVQDQTWASAAFAFANRAGSFDSVAAVAIVLLLALTAMRMRFEAIIVTGVIAVRALQLAIRHTIEWPAGQAEYFYTTRPLPDGGSFPSGHVLGQALVYGLLFWCAPRLISSRAVVIAVQTFCVLVIALGGPARLYVGAHWPSDVIGSMLLAALYLLPALWLDARRTRVTEPRRHEGTEAVEWVQSIDGRSVPAIGRPAG